MLSHAVKPAGSWMCVRMQVSDMTMLHLQYLCGRHEMCTSTANFIITDIAILTLADLRPVVRLHRRCTYAEQDDHLPIVVLCEHCFYREKLVRSCFLLMCPLQQQCLVDMCVCVCSGFVLSQPLFYQKLSQKRFW